MKKYSKSAVVPEGKTPESPQFIALDSVSGLLLVHLAKEYGPKAARSVYDMIKGDEVIFIRIHASWADTEFYYINLEFENLLPHGVYIERITMVAPAGLPMEVEGGGGFSYGSKGGAQRFKPFLLKPYGKTNGSKHVALKFSDSDSKLNGRDHITLECQWTRLDEVKDVDTEKKEFIARIRRSK